MKELVDRFQSLVDHIEQSRRGIKGGRFLAVGI